MAGAVAQWGKCYLAWMRLWVPSAALQKRIKPEK